jgi:phosphatidate cytidylyltransferase
MPSGRRPPSGRRGGSAQSPRDAPAGRRFVDYAEDPEPRSQRVQQQARQRTRQRRPARGGAPNPPQRRSSDLFSRVLVAVPAALAAIVFIDIGGTAWAVFMIVLGCVCLQELYRMLDRWKPVPIIGFAALIGMVLAARFGGLREVVEVAMSAVPVLFIAVLARAQSSGATVSIAGTLLGIYWVGFAFAHAVLLRQLPHGDGILIDVAVGTFLGDTAAYLGGRMFGRRPLAPEISPNKTVEGLFCGMLIAVVSVFFAGLYQDWLTQGDALLLGLAVAVLGPIGDLFESLIKRDAGAKDAGTLFGAHGGALDRLDAVMFTVVAGYYIWVAVPHVH